MNDKQKGGKTMNEINFDDNFKENLGVNDFILVVGEETTTDDTHSESFYVERITKVFDDYILTKSNKNIKMNDIKNNIGQYTKNPNCSFYKNNK